VEEVVAPPVAGPRASSEQSASPRRDERFSKARRVLKRRDFLRAQRQGRSARGRCYVVVIHRRSDEEPARLGVVASRKVGNAVARNRGKRLVREWFRRRSQPLTDPIDLVVILRLGAAALSYSMACADLEATLAKALSNGPRRGRRPPKGRRRDHR
jgi:ribonuclease P protein component